MKIVLGLLRTAAYRILLTFLFVGATYSYLWQDVPKASGDTSGYVLTALDLADGSIDQLNERVPGLPLLLYLTNSHVNPNRSFWFVQLMLYFSAIWLQCVLLFYFQFQSRVVYLFVGKMLLPPNVEYAGYLLTENLAQFLLVVSVFGLVKWFQSQNSLYVCMSALTLSLLALTRPTYQALPIVLVSFLAFLWIYFKPSPVLKRAKSAMAVVLIGFVLIVGGYCYLNYSKFGYFGITTLLGYNLSTKTVSNLEKLPEEYKELREFLIEARDKELVVRGSSHSASQSIWSLGPDEIE